MTDQYRYDLPADDREPTTVEDYQFEPMLNLTLLTGRAALLTNVVLYDRDDASERERAARCNNALVERGIAAGYPPFRCSIDSFRHLGANDSPYWRFVRQLKRAADPEGVIAPGRYSPWVFHDAS